MATCPTCQEPMLTEWPHAHRRPICDECGHRLPHEHKPDGSCSGCGTDEEND